MTTLKIGMMFWNSLKNSLTKICNKIQKQTNDEIIGREISLNLE